MTVFFVRFLVVVFGWLPFRAIYFLSDILFVIIYYMVGYRKKLVIDNIGLAFPDMTSAERRKLAKKFFRNFCDILLETPKGFTMSSEDFLNRYQVINHGCTDALYEKKQSYIAVAPHLGNWEWGVVSLARMMKHNLIGVYKPLHNKKVENYFIEKRTRMGMILLPLKNTRAGFEKYIKELSCFMMMGDQNPGSIRKAHWVDFFGHRLPALQGIDNYARRYNLPVVYVKIKKTKRGYYTLEEEWLVEDASKYGQGEITQLFMTAVENHIKECPELFIWSHKRFKHLGREEEIAALKAAENS